MTTKQILEKANNNTEIIFAGNFAGRSQYRLHDWNEKSNAWYESTSTFNYPMALLHLKESRIETVARELYGEAWYYSVDLNNIQSYTDWRELARKMINHARKNNLGIFSENN